MQCREYNYIDKTKCLQEGIDRFPSVYIEGNAASGKTAAVRMFLAKYPEVIIRMFDFSVELKQSKKLLTEIQSLQKQMKEQCVWVVCENIPGRLDPEVAQAMVQMVQESQKNTRVFFISREKPQAEFLKLLWNDKMDLISMDRLLLSKEEVHVLAERIQSKCDVDRIYEKTGGWAGCVNMLLRLSKNKDDSIEELLRSYEMKNYIQQEIFSAHSEREKDLLEYVAGCPSLGGNRKFFGNSEISV